MTKILTLILTGIQSFTNPLSLVITIATLGIGLLKFINTMWAALFAKIVALTLPTAVVPSVLSGLGFADYVFPVHELFTFGVAYCAFYAACALIRIIKSFVPTVA